MPFIVSLCDYVAKPQNEMVFFTVHYGGYSNAAAVDIVFTKTKYTLGIVICSIGWCYFMYFQHQLLV